MKLFKIGQRWMSETEPELGLGIVSDLEDKQVHIHFLFCETTRTYGMRTAPLKRVSFQIGDEIKKRGEGAVEVTEVIEEDGLFRYVHESGKIIEEDLEDALLFNRPEEKLYNGSIDSEDFFHLRIKTLEYKKEWEESALKGFFGGRVSLIPHQFFLVQKLCEQSFPRVLLADEVGLGKTIEVALSLHHLLLSNRVERVLIIVPDSLVLQWFFELHRKFNLGFHAISQETPPGPGEHPFLDHDRVIVSMGLLKGSELAREMLDEASFDVLVVDEAHQYNYEKDGQNFEYDLLVELAERIPSVFLLTATPEQAGMEGHFYRLKILDSDRYSDYESFKKEVANYEKVASLGRSIVEGESLNEHPLAPELFDSQTIKLLENKDSSENERESALKKLIDRQGTGRTFFRNTRARMSKEYDFFPKRVLHSYPLEPQGQESKDFKQKALWLIEYLSKHDEKTLLIAHSKKQIVDLEKIIKENVTGIKTALFHSGLGLMARDRQAAFFSDPKGAQLLLCTEIGSEGRNFEFAHHLVLFDLPKKPDLLEQRIGRLDRIGQKSDIHLHVPYLLDGRENIYFKIYHEGLDCFNRFSPVGTPVFVKFTEKIKSLLERDNSTSEEQELFLKEMIDYRVNLEKEIEEGRDYLIEKNSFDGAKAQSIIQSIKRKEEQRDLSIYMDKVFQTFGVDVDELHEYATFIIPNDNMFIPHFPHLPKEGVTFTMDRNEACQREDYQWMSWDHPMVRETMELILSDSLGNLTVAIRKSGPAKKSFIEAFFVVDCLAPKIIQLSNDIPPLIIRVLVDKEGSDFAEKWSKEDLDDKLIQADMATLEKARKIPRPMFKGLIKAAEEHAQRKVSPWIEEKREKLSLRMDLEINRLEELKKVNPSISEEEISYLRDMKLAKLSASENYQLRLEAIRIIL